MGRGGARPNSGPDGAYPNLGKTKAIKLPESRHEQFKAIAKHLDAGGDVELIDKCGGAKPRVSSPPNRQPDLLVAQIEIARAILGQALEANKADATGMKPSIHKLIEAAAGVLAEASGSHPDGGHETAALEAPTSTRNSKESPEIVLKGKRA
ncbi:hypothetical protein D3C72_535080 [compost metagenome]